MRCLRFWVAGEDGTVIPWMLGLLVMVLFLGGLSVDLWRAFSARQALAGAVDAASVSGASAIDEDMYRSSGVVELDPHLAERRALANLEAQTETAALIAATVSANESEITVTAQGSVTLTLMRVLLADRGPMVFTATAVASPRAAP